MAESTGPAASIQTDLEPETLGLVSVTMQAITHIAALLFTQFLATLAGVTAPLAYVVAVVIVLMLGNTLSSSRGIEDPVELRTAYSPSAWSPVSLLHFNSAGPVSQAILTYQTNLHTVSWPTSGDQMLIAWTRGRVPPNLDTPWIGGRNQSAPVNRVAASCSGGARVW